MTKRGQDISVNETSTVLLRELAQSGSDVLWTRFVAFWRPRLRWLLARSGVRETDAEDAVQASFARIHAGLRNGRYVRSRGRLSAWIFGIAARAAMDVKRRDARHQAKVRSAQGFVLPEDHPPSQVPGDELRTLLEQARKLAATDPRDAVVFESLIVGNVGAGEVAHELGISVEHVYLIKHRLIRRLRESMARSG